MLLCTLTLTIKLINLVKLLRAIREGLMDDHLCRHRGDKGRALRRDMCSYCCRIGNKLSSSSYTIRQCICIKLHQNAKLSYVQVARWLLAELEGFLTVEVANSYQWLFIWICMLGFLWVWVGKEQETTNKARKLQWTCLGGDKLDSRLMSTYLSLNGGCRSHSPRTAQSLHRNIWSRLFC